MAQVLAASRPPDWRSVNPENTARHLDRNIALVGRVLSRACRCCRAWRASAELCSQGQPTELITAVRVAADVPVAERTELEVLRIDLCNAPLPVRAADHSP